MLLAMMSPLLAGPIAHIRLRSFKRRRFRSLAVFLIGYGAHGWHGPRVGVLRCRCPCRRRLS
jgi:hypothetical protein